MKSNVMARGPRSRAAQLGALVLTLASMPGYPQAGSCFDQTTASKRLDPESLRTVVITDPSVLQQADFSFGRTIGAIVRSATGDADADTPAERIATVTSLVRSFRANEQVNSDSGLQIPLTQRTFEAKLDPLKLLDPADNQGMRVVGLFNRFDLAPNDFNNCGEYRIVYAKGDGSNPLDRMTLIFEAAYDNPDPSNRPEGCRPIVEFWDELRGKTGGDLAKALEQFYFLGVDFDKDGTAERPVIHHEHFGVPLGQVRGNLFVTGGDFAKHPWQLREWRLSINPDQSVVFTPDTVKKSPLPALYRNAGSGEAPSLGAFRSAFLEDFAKERLSELTAPDAAALKSGTRKPAVTLINEFAANFKNTFNGFESTSQVGRINDDPAQGTAEEMTSRLQAGLEQSGLDSGCSLTPQHLLTRAGVLSCGGCHEFSVSKEIAPGVAWPAALGFVHIDEKGELSPALLDVFLPARRQVMDDFLAADGSVSPASSEAAGNRVASRAAFKEAAEAETRTDALESIRQMEPSIEAARLHDANTPGAFREVRRTH